MTHTRTDALEELVVTPEGVTRARPRANSTQGFTSVDPLGSKFSWVSPYNYAENSPIAHIDLYGLQKAQVVARVYTGETNSVESAEAIKAFTFIAVDISAPALNEMIHRYNQTANWNTKIPSFPSYLATTLSVHTLVKNVDAGMDVREMGDEVKRIETEAAAAGASVSIFFGMLPHPLAKAATPLFGAIIAQSGEPNSSINLNNDKLANAYSMSLDANKSHSHQSRARQVPLAKYSVVEVFTVTITPPGGGPPKSTTYRKGYPGYHTVGYMALEYDIVGGGNSRDYLAEGTSVETSYEIIKSEK